MAELPLARARGATRKQSGDSTRQQIADPQANRWEELKRQLPSAGDVTYALMEGLLTGADMVRAFMDSRKAAVGAVASTKNPIVTELPSEADVPSVADVLSEADVVSDAKVSSETDVPTVRPVALIRDPTPRREIFKWAPGESSRLSLRPFRHLDIWEFRQKISGLHWDASEVSFAKDRAQWVKMSPEMQRFVSMQLALFSRIDIDALDFIDGLTEKVDCMEARAYYLAQGNQEVTHADSYTLQIEVLVDGAERDRLLNAAKGMPVIRRIREWVQKWFDKAIPVEEQLVAFAGVEGVMLQGSFAALQLLRDQNLLPGITKSNDYISRDEGVHAGNTCLLVRKYLCTKPPASVVYRIIDELVSQIVDPFIDEAIPTRLLGVNSEIMKSYVRFQANSILMQMDYPAYYDTKTNPIVSMEKLSLNGVRKVNFFEETPSEYQGVTEEGMSSFSLGGGPVADSDDE